MEKVTVLDLINTKLLFKMKLYKLYIPVILISCFLVMNKSFAQNCPGLNVIGSFYDLPTGTPPNFTTAQSSGLCYELHPPYPAQVCFEYMIPTSDTVRATFHLKACGSQSSIGTGTYSAGCSGTASTNATFTGQSTYDNNCNLIGNYIAVGYCGGAVSGDIMTVCFDLNTSSACDPITICPMLFCNTSICSTGLPIELISFSSKCNDGNSVLLWQTASEINNDYFIIEKSKDGNLFNEIGTIKGAGNSSSIIEYSFVDDEASETSYYRLKQIDFNGEYSYSNIIANKCDNKNFNIYPNPATNTLNINLDYSDNQSLTKAIIYNSIGQVIKEVKLTNKLNTINIENLENGLYHIQLQSDKQIITTKKFTKQ